MGLGFWYFGLEFFGSDCFVLMFFGGWGSVCGGLLRRDLGYNDCDEWCCGEMVVLMLDKCFLCFWRLWIFMVCIFVGFCFWYCCLRRNFWFMVESFLEWMGVLEFCCFGFVGVRLIGICFVWCCDLVLCGVKLCVMVFFVFFFGEFFVCFLGDFIIVGL